VKFLKTIYKNQENLKERRVSSSIFSTICHAFEESFGVMNIGTRNLNTNKRIIKDKLKTYRTKNKAN